MQDDLEFNFNFNDYQEGDDNFIGEEYKSILHKPVDMNSNYRIYKNKKGNFSNYETKTFLFIGNPRLEKKETLKLLKKKFIKNNLLFLGK
jgi:hypothetical protein